MPGGGDAGMWRGKCRVRLILDGRKSGKWELQRHGTCILYPGVYFVKRITSVGHRLVGSVGFMEPAWL